MNVVMMPMWIMSGVFFSPSRFPAFLQPFVQALPLTAAISAIRGNMLQGIPLGHMMAPLAILLVWCAVPFVCRLGYFDGDEKCKEIGNRKQGIEDSSEPLVL